MLLWIIQISIISVIFIFLVHNLIGFFKSTLTVPKIKDLVTTPNQKYENMFNVMSSKLNTFDQEDDPTNFGIESTTTTTNMKDELKNFLKQQMNTPSSTTDISFLDSMNVAPGISSFSSSSASSQGNYSNY